MAAESAAESPSPGFIVVIQPGKPVEIRGAGVLSLEESQAIVGGWIEMIAIEPGIDLVCHEEGKLLMLPLTVALPDRADIVAGPCFLVGVNDDGEMVGLSDAQAARFALELQERRQHLIEGLSWRGPSLRVKL